MKNTLPNNTPKPAKTTNLEDFNVKGLTDETKTNKNLMTSVREKKKSRENRVGLVFPVGLI